MMNWTISFSINFPWTQFAWGEDELLEGSKLGLTSFIFEGPSLVRNATVT